MLIYMNQNEWLYNEEITQIRMTNEWMLESTFARVGLYIFKA